MIYRTKADLLGRLWKARSDVRLIDRMVGRGEVKKTSEWYELNENFFIKWVNEYDKNMIQNNTTYDKNITLPDKNLENQVKDLKDHLRFFYEMDLARKAAMEKVVQWMFNKNQGAWWDEAIIKANKFMEFEPNPLEEEEIEYVGGLNL